jgi:gas vesicle protein
MENNIEEYAYGINNTRNVLIGLLIGGLVGAAAMLLFAPQSGKRTRAQIEHKSIQLRNRTTKNVKKAVAQVRSKTNSITAEVRDVAGELKHLGQDKLVEQLDRVSAALDAGKTAVEDA